MAIKELTCTLCHPMRALNLIRGKVNELIKAVNAGGGGSSGGGTADPVIKFTFDEEGNLTCGYTPAEVQQMYFENSYIRFQYGTEIEGYFPLQCAFAVMEEGVYLSLCMLTNTGSEVGFMPVITVSDNAFIPIN